MKEIEEEEIDVNDVDYPDEFNAITIDDEGDVITEDDYSDDCLGNYC